MGLVSVEEHEIIVFMGAWGYALGGALCENVEINDMVQSKWTTILEWYVVKCGCPY